MSKFNSDIKIRLTIKKDYLVESLFVFFLLMMGLLSGYFGRNVFWLAGLVGFNALLWVCKSKYRREIGSALFKSTPFYAVVFFGMCKYCVGFKQSISCL